MSQSPSHHDDPGAWPAAYGQPSPLRGGRAPIVTDGDCQPLPAQEVTFTVPRVVQRTIVEPKVVHRTQMQRKAVENTVIDTVPYEETITIPEVRKTKCMKDVEVYEVQEVERTLKSIVVEPRTVKKKVIVTRPEVKTIETTELRAEPVEVEKEIKKMVMVPTTEKSTHMDTEVVMHTRQVPQTLSVPKLTFTAKTADPAVMQRILQYIRVQFSKELDSFDIMQATEQRTVMVEEQYPETREVPRMIDQVRMVPQEQVQTIKVTEIRDVEVPITREVVEMVEEEQEIECTEMVETVTEHVVKEPQLVTKTVSVPDEKVDIVKVPRKVQSHRSIERTVTDFVEEPIQVPHTEMVTRCVQDHYEETRTLRFDPVTGEQISAISTTTPQQPTGQPYASPVSQHPPPPRPAQTRELEPEQTSMGGLVWNAPDPGQPQQVYQQPVHYQQPRHYTETHRQETYPEVHRQDHSAPSPMPQPPAGAPSPQPPAQYPLSEVPPPPQPDQHESPPRKNLTPEEAQKIMQQEIFKAKARSGSIHARARASSMTLEQQQQSIARDHSSTPRHVTHPEPMPEQQYRQQTMPEQPKQGQNCVPVWLCGGAGQPLPTAGSPMPGQPGMTIVSVGQPQPAPRQ